MRIWRSAALGIVSLALLGCATPAMAQEQESPGSKFHVDPSNPIQGEPPIEATLPTGPVDPALQPQIEIAQQDLGARLSFDNWSEIEVLEARAVTWPDGGLGCPTPGMAYIQVLVDGALIRLNGDGKLYEYHSGGARAPFLCEKPAPAPPPPGDPMAPPPGGGEGV
jgi:hypothetical protein